MALIDERLPTYTVHDGTLYEELKNHAERAWSRTGVEQVIRDHEGNIVDVIGVNTST